MPDTYVAPDKTTRSIGLVVKGAPLNFTVALSHPPALPVTFSNLKFSAKLLYYPDEKEVKQVKGPPMSSKIVFNEAGSLAYVECRLDVLTSQCENTLFQVRFEALDPTRKFVANPICCTSKPIKSVSKLDTGRKSKNRAQAQAAQPEKKKAAPSDLVLEKFREVETLQQQQIDLLGQISDEMSQISTHLQPPPKKHKTFQEEDSNDLAKSFMMFLEEFDTLTDDEQINKIRSAIGQNHNHHTDFTELHDMLSDILGSSGTDLYDADADAGNYETQCNCPDCPHLAQLQSLGELTSSIYP
eukprot:TRINITY_DN2619_c0_g1_i1.p1 TRINITY_DN2619_c0_g1~~TRINITY_DN2619_c0_g1_i1.p1  ORF type:complete len:332 (+),score=125.05 TRINITY_DN2619_c0_g1_i1:101-997(+)